MTSIEEARRRLSTVRPRLHTEQVPIGEAWGRTLAEPVVARNDLPPFARAAMDGYALRAEDTALAPVWLPVRGEAGAGDPPAVLTAGSVVRVLTGAVVPIGADAVLEQEAVESAEGAVRVARPVARGRNIMPQGHEWAAGATVLRAGERLFSTHLGLLSGLGIRAVTVYAPLRAAVVQTGNELRSPGMPLQAGQIYETHAAWLTALIHEWGGVPTGTLRVPDHPGQILRAIEAALVDADLVLVTGGVSVGDRDYVAAVLADVGERLFWRVAMHPGKAVAAAASDSRLILALSGNPGAAMTSWLVLGAPWWAGAHGGILAARDDVRALREAFPKPSREPRFLRVREVGGQLSWDLAQGSDTLTPYLSADGFAVIPAGTREVPRGARVAYWAPAGMGGRTPRWTAALTEC
jgi:molybdopterin molybdotransferase